MPLERLSHCKINLILNILGKRPDGFHELETLLLPVPLHDRLSFDHAPGGIHLSCNLPDLPVDSGNLVFKAAEKFFAATQLTSGVRIHLEKNIPLAAGLGGGSGNAAATLLGLNDLFDRPLTAAKLQELAAALGSDVPFFLQENPALGFGRGEQVEPLGKISAFTGTALFLIHPGFGVSTPWAYKNLARFPADFQGTPGRARRLAAHLQSGNLKTAAADIYNSLEAPVFEKHPILRLFKEFLAEHGAMTAMMSGSGSTTFALAPSHAEGKRLASAFEEHFLGTCWRALIPL